MNAAAPNSAPAGRAHWALLALFTAVLLSVNYLYSLANTRPPTYDDAWYLETSLHFYHHLTDGGLAAFLPAYARSFGTKAPLISVLPLPFYLLFGTGYSTALLVNGLFLVISNFYLFLLARRLFSADAALAAVVFYQTMPLAYGLSRVFMADYGLAALVIVWLYYLVDSDGLRRGSSNFILGVVLGLGLLMKILFPAFIAGPLLYVLLRRRQQPAEPPSESFRLWRACAERPLAAIGGVGLAIASTWYAFNWDSILRYAWQGAYGEIGMQYSAGGLHHWILQVINEALSFHYTAAVIVLGLAALALGRRSAQSSATRPGQPNEARWLLLGWLAPPLVAIAAGSNREIRFVVALLPAVAIVLAAAVFRLGGRRPVQIALAAALAIFPLRLFAALSFVPSGIARYHPGHPVQLGPFVLFSRDLNWARPPDSRGHWGQERILEAIDHMAPKSTRRRYVVLGVEHPYLNANLLSYLNAYRNYPFNFTSLGYAETSVQKAIERLYSLDARFLVMAEGFHNTDLADFLNRVNGEVQARLDRGDLLFRLRAKVKLGDNIRAVIYEREAPWTRFPPGQQPDAPSHPLVVDFAGGVRFLGYDWKPKNHYLQELSTYWTSPHHVNEDYRVRVDFRRGDHEVLSEDYSVAGGAHPFYDWEAGETVKQTIFVYVPGAEGEPLEASLWLAPWGVGSPLQIALPREMVHASVIPLRLEE